MIDTVLRGRAQQHTEYHTIHSTGQQNTTVGGGSLNRGRNAQGYSYM